MTADPSLLGGQDHPAASAGSQVREARRSRIFRLLRGHRRRLPGLERRAGGWSWLRLLSFVSAFGAGLVALLLDGLPVAIGVILLGLLIFVAVVRRHLELEAALRRRRARIQILDEQRARHALDWSGLPPARALQPRADHPIELDLDLVGSRGLHRLLDRCATEAGSRRLRDWLGDGLADPRRLAERQAALREMSPLAHFRDRLVLEGRLALAGDQAFRIDPLEAFLAQPARPRELARWSAGLGLLALTTALLALWALLGGPRWWPFSFTLYAMLWLTQQARVAPAFSVVGGLGDGLSQLASVFSVIERQDLTDRPRLAARCAPIQDAKRSPSIALRSLRRLIGGASIRANFFVWLPLNALLPWDIWVAWRIDRLRLGLARDLPAWLDCWQELEALDGLANLAWLEPERAFAEIRSADDMAPLLIEARSLGHPLLPPEAKVRNDLRVDALGEIHLVTGSNMAGKSTWLRTVGINLALAFAGGPVDASSLRCPPLRLFACTRVSDSVTDGISYFYAEVRRLRALLDSLEEDADPRPLAWFIDEIFRGTNNRERLIGSRSLIRSLAGGRGVGWISTHDLELAGLEQAVEGLKNFHFREQVEGDRMVFDHRLRSGPCPTTNALQLMAGAGLPIDPETPI